MSGRRVSATVTVTGGETMTFTLDCWLLPRHRVGLLCFAGDAGRFATLFRSTWKQLPLYARRAMLRYWRGQPPPTMLLSPTIELTEAFTGFWRRGDYSIRDRDAYAVTSAAGFKLSFNAVLFGDMPDDVACNLIAHELAHVCQWAWRTDHEQPVGADPEEAEEEADDITTDWGYPPEMFDDWALTTGRARVIEHPTAEDIRMAAEKRRLDGR